MVNFLYPNEKEIKDIEELQNIIRLLSRKPTLQQTKYIRLLRRLTKGMFLAGKTEKKDKEKIEILKKAKVTNLEMALPKEQPFRLPPPPPPPGIDLDNYSYSLISTNINNKNIILASVNIKKTPEGRVYELVESQLSETDRQIINRTRLLVLDDLDKDSELTKKLDYLDTKIIKVCKDMGLPISEEYTLKIKYNLFKIIFGFGLLDPLIDDKSISSIICDSFDKISITRDSQTIPTNLNFNSEDDLRSYINQIASKFNKKLSEENPLEIINYKNLKIQLSINPLKFGFAKS